MSLMQVRYSSTGDEPTFRACHRHQPPTSCCYSNFFHVSIFLLLLYSGILNLGIAHITAGIGVYFPQLSLRIACRLHGEVQNIERAETQAAVTALKIARHFASRYSSITLRTDSLNLMLFVKHFKGLWDLYCCTYTQQN